MPLGAYSGTRGGPGLIFDVDIWVTIVCGPRLGNKTRSYATDWTGVLDRSPKNRWGWARTMSEDVQSAGSASRPWPTDQPVIDTLIGFGDDPDRLYAGIRRSLRDRESLEELEMPAGYMFHDLPPAPPWTSRIPSRSRSVRWTGSAGIRTGLVSLSSNTEVTESALTRYPGSLVPSWTFDPNDGVKGMAALVRAHERWGVRAASFFPHGTSPQVAIDAARLHYYAKGDELGIGYSSRSG